MLYFGLLLINFLNMDERQDESTRIPLGGALGMAFVAGAVGLGVGSWMSAPVDDWRESSCLEDELEGAKTGGNVSTAFDECFPEDGFAEARTSIAKVVELEEVADQEAEEELALCETERDGAFGGLDAAAMVHYERLQLVVTEICPQVKGESEACDSMQEELDMYENPGGATE